MMKRTATIFSILCLLLSAACNNGNRSDEAIYASGVSQELAQLRRQNIKNVQYDLFFSIPRDAKESVTGTADIGFTLDASQEIILDFEQGENVGEISINGSITRCEAVNQHIIIPCEATKKGENNIRVSFVAGDRSLNRNEEFLYTLFVPDRARTVFPCFEQPDLKASFRLQLEIPSEWTAVSNSPIASESNCQERKTVTFEPTEPLSTYLFSFVAGILDKQEYNADGRTLTAYYRETAPERIAQLPVIFEQVAAAIRYMEEYTGIAYPFAKYDFIMLPGFQYGGMEHTGATLYNDAQLFLGAHPTPDEELSRAQLIAHETAHMWFGDLVTMEWFDDVWTKEVFANYFESRMTEGLFPEINHRLNRLRSIVVSAMSEDRTQGTTPIKQELDNLNDAGLIYSNIIYDKSPIMLEKLVEQMGEEAFRAGVREYLAEYSYGNATWEDLITILDKKSDKNLRLFSNVWVHEKGMPHLFFKKSGDTLIVRQHDPYGRKLVWPQRFSVRITGNDTSDIEVNITDTLHKIKIAADAQIILPNIDGKGYGFFYPDSVGIEWLLHNLHTIDEETGRQAQLTNLHECYQQGIISASQWAIPVMKGLLTESNTLSALTLCSYLPAIMRELPSDSIEKQMLTLSKEHRIAACRQQLLRTLSSSAVSLPVCEELYAIWESGSHPLLSETDYMNMAYELALRFPDREEYITKKQGGRIKNRDRQRQFAFISQAVTPDTDKQEELFRKLLTPEGRHTEPWAIKALSLLCHRLREEQSVKYIRPALDAMQEIQRTNDIFFPTRWAKALLREHRSHEALKEVERFMNDNPHYPQLLKNKILQASWALYRANNR